MTTHLEHLIKDELDASERSKIVAELKQVVQNIHEDRKINRVQFQAALNNFHRLCISDGEASFTEACSIVEPVILEFNYEDKIKNSTDVLKEYTSNWKVFARRMSLINGLFSYLDRNYIFTENERSEPKVPIDEPLEKIPKMKMRIMRIWKSMLMNMKDILMENILLFAESERKANANSQCPEIKAIVESIDAVDDIENNDSEDKIYETIIEQPLQRHLDEYFGKKALEDFKSMSFKDYVTMCNDTLKHEEQFMANHFNRSTKLIKNTVWMRMVNDHLKELLEKTINNFKCEEFENVKIAYTSLKYSKEATDEINKEIETRAGKIFATITETSDATNFCANFLAAYSKEKELLQSVFDPSIGPISAMEKGISKVISKESNQTKSTDVVSRVPDILVSYADQIMKSGTKGMSETEIEKKLDDIVTIFQYVEDKDVFIELYAKRLSARLIYSSSQSKEAEEMMVNKLKIKCGHQFVVKVEKMLTDVELSKEVTLKFNNDNILPFTFSILVTQTGSWPFQASKSTLVLPKQLSSILVQFNEFYTNNYKGRVLHWNHRLSLCDIKANYLSKSCIIQTSMPVTAILTQFNEMESATFEELRISTDIEKHHLLKLLQYLLTQNILIIDGNVVTEKSTFSLNYKYDSKRARVKLVPIFKDAKQETNETTKVVMEDRKYYLQALMVRIMKSKKTMSHKDLTNETIQHSITSFVPSQVLLKSVIDFLIEKEYLTKEGDMYTYLA